MKFTEAEIEAFAWKDVDGSSNVKRVARDDEATGTFVQFHSGGIYHYADVPDETHTVLEEAGSDPKLSIGRLIHTAFRGNYISTKVEVITNEGAQQ
jgi:hypothetical protein